MTEKPSSAWRGLVPLAEAEGITWGHARVGDTVEYAGEVLRGANPDMLLVGGAWAVDGIRVWRMSSWLKSADAATFTPLSYSFGKDANRVWTLWHQVKDVDAATFRALDGGVVWTGTGTAWEPEDYGYGADGEKVVFSATIDPPVLVEGADPGTFVSLGGLFGHDATACFAYGRKLAGATPADWRIVTDGLYYSVSAGTVYYVWRPVPGADAETFETQPVEVHGHTVQAARDAHNLYVNGEPVTPEEFTQRTTTT